MNGIWLASYVALWLLVAAETLVFLALLRQVGVLHTRIGPRGAMTMEGPGLGDLAPSEGFPTVDGRDFVFRASNPQARLVALFVDPSCSACDAVMTSFRTFVRSMKQSIEGVVVVAAEPSDAASWSRKRHWKGPVIASTRPLEVLKIPSTPFAVTFDANGRILAAGLVNSLEQLESLIETEKGQPAAPDERDLAEPDGKGATWEAASMR
jgi:methylamine dehydrogenase accessory protein MauD